MQPTGPSWGVLAEKPVVKVSVGTPKVTLASAATQPPAPWAHDDRNAWPRGTPREWATVLAPQFHGHRA